MGSFVRGFKNAFRNNVRTLAIIVILAVSIGLALVMLMAWQTVQNKIANVKSTIGNYITISPAGIRGMEGGGELLTDTDVATIATLPHVSGVVKAISDRLTPDQDTSLQSAVDPGSFGNRQQTRQQESLNQDANGQATQNTQRTFTMPITINGTSDLSTLSSLNASQLNVTPGEKFLENTTDKVALVGTELATKNNLSVGSTFQVYGQSIKVVGIIDAGNRFTNASVIFPITVLQNLSGQSEKISSMIVQADSIDTVSSVQSDIKAKLGDRVDVISQQDSSQSALQPLENICSITLYSLIGALSGGAIIIFLTMVMIVRERKREIGVLKAIGASNLAITTQFVVESLVLTIISSIVGIVLGVVLSNPILKVLVNNSDSAASGGAPGAGRGFMLRLGMNAQDTLRDLHATVGYEILLYGLVAAVAIAVIGSAIPAYLIAKIRPAEVMRSE